MFDLKEKKTEGLCSAHTLSNGFSQQAEWISAEFKNRGLFKLTRNGCWRGELRRGLVVELVGGPAPVGRGMVGRAPGATSFWKVRTDAAARLWKCC